MASQNVNDEAKNRIVDQLENWIKKENELRNWVLSHDYEHALFEQKSSELNAATWKIMQLKDRRDRKPGKTKREHSFPNIN